MSSFLVISLNKNSQNSEKPRNSEAKGMPPIFTLMREFTVTAQYFLTYLLDIPIGGSQERVLKDGPRLGAEVLREGRCLEVLYVVGSPS